MAVKTPLSRVLGREMAAERLRELQAELMKIYLAFPQLRDAQIRDTRRPRLSVKAAAARPCESEQAGEVPALITGPEAQRTH